MFCFKVKKYKSEIELGYEKRKCSIMRESEEELFNQIKFEIEREKELFHKVKL